MEPSRHPFPPVVRWVVAPGVLAGFGIGAGLLLMTDRDLVGLASALEDMDAALPEAGSFEEVDVLELGREFLSAEDLYVELRKRRCMCNEDKVSWWSAWRYGFSDRLMVASAMDHAWGYAAQSAAVRGVPYAEAQSAWDRLMKDMVRASNPLVRSHVVGYSGRDRSVRDRRAQIRILRWAAHYRATGEKLSMPDPFGTFLRHEISEGRVKVWSVGRNGLDDGGRGGWKFDDDDVVLEGACPPVDR